MALRLGAWSPAYPRLSRLVVGSPRPQRPPWSPERASRQALTAVERAREGIGTFAKALSVLTATAWWRKEWGRR